MGILNTTPDSFSDGGSYTTVENALSRAVAMAEEGADLIDVGGEKAGPGEPVPVEEELRRVVPVIEAIRRELDVVVSVDTLKARVAQRAVEAGADIINSIGGFAQPEMRSVAASSGAAIVVMHIQGRPRVPNPNPVYADVVNDVRRSLARQVGLCEDSGVAPNRIIIDPGPDFGKTTEQSLAVVANIKQLAALQYPILLAVSRKRFIGDVLRANVQERLEGSLATAVWGVLQGVKLVRAHDVRATSRVVRMTEAVLHPEMVEAAG